MSLVEDDVEDAVPRVDNDIVLNTVDDVINSPDDAGVSSNNVDTQPKAGGESGVGVVALEEGDAVADHATAGRTLRPRRARRAHQDQNFVYYGTKKKSRK